MIETIEIGSDRVTVFRQEKEATKTSSIILRGSTINYLDDVERALDDGVNAIKSLTKDGRLVIGAGCVEIQIASALFNMGEKTPGLAQYGIKKYAEALESISQSLAENSGLNFTETISQLYAAHAQESHFFGVNVDAVNVSESAKTTGSQNEVINRNIKIVFGQENQRDDLVDVYADFLQA